MRDASEYRRFAAECRTLAAQLAGPAREQLLRMAETWEALAAGDGHAGTKREDPPRPG